LGSTWFGEVNLWSYAVSWLGQQHTFSAQPLVEQVLTSAHDEMYYYTLRERSLNLFMIARFFCHGDILQDMNVDIHPSTRASNLKRYNVDSGPNEEWLADFWPKLMIELVAVAITSDKEAIVQNSLAARLPRIGDLARETEANGVDWSDPCYLACAISRQAYEILMEQFESADCFEDTTFSYCMRAHRNTDLFIGPDLFFLPLCRSDRPAFIVDADDANIKGGKTTEFLHMYTCMSLEHAIEVRHVLLVRCKHHAVAAAVVHDASCNFGFEHKRNLVHYYIEDPVSKQLAESTWDQLMQKVCPQVQSRPVPTYSRGDLLAEHICLLEECLDIAEGSRCSFDTSGFPGWQGSRLHPLGEYS
jgi:hypothetical protein